MSVIGNRCPDTVAFTWAIRTWLEKRAATLREANPGWNANPDALQSLATHVTTLEVDDQRLYALYLAQGQLNEFKPGPQATRFFSLLGIDDSPPFDEALAELVGATVQDLLDEGHLKLSRADVNRAVTLKLEEQLAEAQGDLHQMRERIEELEREIGAAGEELERTADQHDRLREQIEAGGSKAAAPARKSSKPPRRERVEGHTGVYQRVTPDGETVYEVTWTEDGRKRWMTTGTDLAEAIKTRELMAAVPSNEKVLVS